MKIKIIAVLVICFFVTSCTTPNKENTTSSSDAVTVNTPVGRMEVTPVSPVIPTSAESIFWENVFEGSIDLDNDEADESINVCITGKGDVEKFQLKVAVNGSEKIWSFDTDYSIMNFIKCQSIELGKKCNHTINTTAKLK